MIIASIDIKYGNENEYVSASAVVKAPRHQYRAHVSIIYAKNDVRVAKEDTTRQSQGGGGRSNTIALEQILARKGGSLF